MKCNFNLFLLLIAHFAVLDLTSKYSPLSTQYPFVDVKCFFDGACKEVWIGVGPSTKQCVEFIVVTFDRIVRHMFR